VVFIIFSLTFLWFPLAYSASLFFASFSVFLVDHGFGELPLACFCAAILDEVWIARLQLVATPEVQLNLQNGKEINFSSQTGRN
jgi:hypothetical protein